MRDWRFLAGVVAAACASSLACTELRSSPPGGLGGDSGFGGDSGAAGTGGMGGAIACDDSMIGWWRLNDGAGYSATEDSANDACVRNEQAGLLVGGATWTTGHEGAAVAFDGSTGVVAVQPTDGSQLWNYPTVPLTMMAWIRPDTAGIGSAAATAVARTHEDYRFQDFWLGLVNGNPRCAIHDEYGEGPTAIARAPANTWTHLACTYGLDGLTQVYVNGNLAATASTEQLLGPIPTRILIGASEVESSTVLDYFSGAIDDVRMWNRALTGAEVRAIAQQ